MDLPPKLSINNVSRRFQSEGKWVSVLEEISFAVGKGEFLVLVGPSGCGKSTLLNIIAGLDQATEGTVEVDGVRVSQPGPDRSLVFQDGALFPWLTALGNVEFGLRQKGFGALERKERALRYLSMVGLDTYRDYAIHQLSGGMRQRVAIARSLALEPQVLLMDEPFSALDALTREDLYVEMQVLSEKLNTTVVCVTHNVREAATLGDRVILMAPNPGRIQEIFSIDCCRPRQIDDQAVIANAHQISEALKKGRQRPEAGVGTAQN